jgi:hypothetical protein
MTSEAFNKLTQAEKEFLLLKAEQIDEIYDGFITYSLYRVNRFFVEAIEGKEAFFSRKIKAYYLEELPMMYTSKVFAELGNTVY